MRRREAAVVCAFGLAFVAAACQPTKPPPPPGAIGNGFDACTAPSTATMSAWLQSPYRNVGVYIGGSNRGCSQPNLNAAWVNTVHDQGWRLIPTYVGLQAPCASGNVGPRMSSDFNTAIGEGYGSALDAVQSAGALGLGPGTPIYFDMEAYTPSSCGTPVRGFIAGWIFGLHEHQYVAGMYGSAGAGVNDIALAQDDPLYRLDAIWFAHWNGDPSLFDPQYFSDSLWPNARIHQFLGGHDESWGGVVINIDSNQVGGPTG
jgi:hypothetical protein